MPSKAHSSAYVIARIEGGFFEARLGTPASSAIRAALAGQRNARLVVGRNRATARRFSARIDGLPPDQATFVLRSPSGDRLKLSVSAARDVVETKRIRPILANVVSRLALGEPFGADLPEFFTAQPQLEAVAVEGRLIAAVNPPIGTSKSDRAVDQGVPAAPGIPTLEEWVNGAPTKTAQQLAAERLLARARLRERIRKEVALLDAEDAAALAGSQAANHRVHAKRLRQRGALAVKVGQGFKFPLFQFRPDGKVPDEMKQILAAVHAGREPQSIRDGWIAMEWFTGRTGLLSGRRPMDVFVSEPAAVLKAARREFARYLRAEANID